MVKNENGLIKIGIFTKIKKWFKNIFIKPFKKTNSCVIDKENKENYKVEANVEKTNFMENIRVEDNEAIIQKFRREDHNSFSVDELKKVNESYKKIIDNLIYSIEQIGELKSNKITE